MKDQVLGAIKKSMGKKCCGMCVHYQNSFPKKEIIRVAKERGISIAFLIKKEFFSGFCLRYPQKVAKRPDDISCGEFKEVKNV